ncbi:MAG: hypothetical protein C5B49_16265 [Bdellovibrio sp.]|nr:MAG: hypothetical protein C5B49_16265 [Bdellovibrio sp.]
MNGQNAVAVVAVGTEITTGQITNSNASWISAALLKHGLQVHFHRAIDDDRELIEAELKDLENKVQLLFVTGGLGPTSDDLTRDGVSRWSGLPLEWHEESWQRIVARFQRHGLALRDFQRQQCYFPKTSRILTNHQGTANAFQFHLPGRGFAGGGLEVFVLPGPPKEVHAVWNEAIEAWLGERYKDLDRTRVFSWDCLGTGESEIAHHAEAALQDCPFQKGYRVHFPYVEFKLSFLQSQEGEADRWTRRVEEALKPWVVARDGEDPAREFVLSLGSSDEVWFFDGVTEGHLLHRLLPYLRQEQILGKTRFLHQAPGQAPGRPQERYPWRHQSPPSPDWKLARQSIVAGLEKRSDGTAVAQIHLGLQRQWQVLPSPRSALIGVERSHQFLTEQALLFWRRQLLVRRPKIW